MLGEIITVPAQDIRITDRLPSASGMKMFDIVSILDDGKTVTIRFRRGHVGHVSMIRMTEPMSVFRQMELTS